jgi:hypothetical protein
MLYSFKQFHIITNNIFDVIYMIYYAIINYIYTYIYIYTQCICIYIYIYIYIWVQQSPKHPDLLAFLCPKRYMYIQLDICIRIFKHRERARERERERERESIRSWRPHDSFFFSSGRGQIWEIGGRSGSYMAKSGLIGGRSGVDQGQIGNRSVANRGNRTQWPLGLGEAPFLTICR